LMSGLMIKMGIFGIMLTLLVVGFPSVWIAYLVLGLGVVSALIGILYALAQTDIKRIVAYSSVENMGIVLIGIGCGMLGMAYQAPVAACCGFGGALFHVFNHSLFKSLMFHNAGAVLQQTHTRDIEQLGGLAAGMPKTAGCGIIGALTVAALPPGNGFAGELVIYLGLLGCLKSGSGLLAGLAALTMMMLALTGALAMIGFTRLAGMVFLGHPRSEAAARATDPDWRLLAPMGLEAAGCLVTGLLAAPLLRLLRQPVELFVSTGAVWDGVGNTLWWTVGIVTVMAGLMLALALVRRRLLRRHETVLRPTWGCGYDRISVRMQYSGVSYSLPLLRSVNRLFRNEIKEPEVTGLFPRPATFSYRPGDLFLMLLVRPVTESIRRGTGRFTWIQNGNMQAYLLYGIVFLVLVIGGVFIW
ncbi:MAG: proton-conducting transporter membrane subunit, partial [Victivallales bacterium]|nr:proton-conducting transporter membrane subunit [Victivallales bacterium]